MRTLIKVLVPALAVAFQATAQTRRSSDITAAPSGRYSLLGGETVGTGTNVVRGESGWPSITFGYTHGLKRDRDAGEKYDLLFGVEGDSNASQVGIRLHVPFRTVALRGDRLSVLLLVDP